jgi:hypothetical protein
MADALKSGLQNISPGEPSSQLAWRAGRTFGREEGARRYFQSQTMEALSLEILFLRAMVEQQSRRADFWHARFAECVKELLHR